MFITVHTAVGIFIGGHVGNPFLGFLLGLFSHFFIDFIPHGDEKLTKKNFFYCIAATDVLIALTFFSTFCIFKANLNNIKSIVWSTVGAVSPDFICALAELTGLKLFKKIEKLHHFVHSPTQGLINFGVGSLFQLSIFIFAITALLIK